MRFTRFAVVVFATIGLILGLMPGASAHTTHENPPNPPMVGPMVKAACTVDGSVTIVVGVDLTPRHNHYEFTGVNISCTGDSNYTFTNIEVNADGGTDGACSPDPDMRSIPECLNAPAVWHGENDAQGWSHSHDYNGPNGGNMCESPTPPTNPGVPNANRGDITIGSPKPAVGWVKFVRVGVAVTAWGYLNWTTGDKKDDCFLAELVFIPTDTTPPVSTARLTGTAVIYN